MRLKSMPHNEVMEQKNVRKGGLNDIKRVVFLLDSERDVSLGTRILDIKWKMPLL